MPLQKILPKPGVNRENTRYTTEGGWYECDKIRFRQGTPEKIGGWVLTSTNTFLGLCRSLWSWVTLGGINLIGVGTNLKFYINKGGSYFDVTPIRDTVSPMLGAQPPGSGNPFTAVAGSAVIEVEDVDHGCITGDFVTFSGAVGLGGNITAAVLNQEYQVTVINTNRYTFTATATANATDASGSPGGGVACEAEYQINTGPATAVPLTGWGAGPWGYGAWGVGEASNDSMRLWSQSNFGENLVFGPRGGQIYYWEANNGVETRAIPLSALSGASDTPLYQNFIQVSDSSRFVLAFGTNAVGSGSQDPMLIRWCDQENLADWTPTATNQAGDLRLSHGSSIITALQTRQEIVVWTDSSVYSLQYLGPPYVWGSQLLGDNISIAGPNAAALASGITFWMGKDKFYMYDGSVKTLRCDLRKYVFGDIDRGQFDQVFAGTNEGFNEVWWFYCSEGSTVVDKYVIYNYAEDIWYYGTMGRTAWLDSGINAFPIAATYVNNIVTHENGVDNVETGTAQAIEAYITSSQFDIGDGHNMAFVWRMLPDLSFHGSTAASPEATMYLYGLKNSGSGYTVPASVGGSNSAAVIGTSTVPLDEFTGQVYIRIRARQMAIRILSNSVGTTWQMGAPRIDIRPDGRR